VRCNLQSFQAPVVGENAPMTTAPLPPSTDPNDPESSPDPQSAPQPPPEESPPSESWPEPTSDGASSSQSVKSDRRNVEGAAAKARERLQQTRDARSFGGRRTGLVKDEVELARLAALDARLLELARRALRKAR
jgi:hypothetical protein